MLICPYSSDCQGYVSNHAPCVSQTREYEKCRIYQFIRDNPEISGKLNPDGSQVKPMTRFEAFEISQRERGVNSKGLDSFADAEFWREGEEL